jgi:hypothetical protein
MRFRKTGELTATGRTVLMADANHAMAPTISVQNRSLGRLFCTFCNFFGGKLLKALEQAQNGFGLPIGGLCNVAQI